MSTDARVRKLRRYIPFLKRRQEQLSSRGDLGESDKVKNLIAVISNNVGELNPGVLEKCERVCEDLYSRFGRKEDDIKPNIVNQPRQDPRIIPHERVSSPQNRREDQTPRSPSPEEAQQSFGTPPKPIPSEMWPQQMQPAPNGGPSPFSRDVDVDYRQPWGPGPSAFPKRESRFDRYGPGFMERPPQWEAPRYERPPFQPYERQQFERFEPQSYDRHQQYSHPPFQPQSFYRPWQNEQQFHRPYWSEQPQWDNRDHYSRPARPQGPRRDDSRPRSGPRPQKSPQQNRKHQQTSPARSSSNDASKEKVRERSKERQKEKPKDEPKEKSKDEPREKPKERQSDVHQESPQTSEAPEVEEKEVKKADFVSPLGNLYTDAPKPAQTGKGYGIQSYKIPLRKKTPPSQSKKIEKPHEEHETAQEEAAQTQIDVTETEKSPPDAEVIEEIEKVKEDEADKEIPLEVVENFLKKRLPSTQAQVVLECLKSNSKEQAKETESESSVVSKEPVGDDATIDATVTSTSEAEPVVPVEQTEKTETEEAESLTAKKKAGRKKGSGELGRLREDLTDKMMPIDLGQVRRTRAKTNPEPKQEEIVKRPDTRARKRKNTAPEIHQTFEESNIEENKTSNVLSADEKDRESPDGPGKSKKRKKIFQPTRLSLRGKRSMYENEEEYGDDYFQCRECPYFGQKIVHHYVNLHGSVEIPYVAVPDSEWERIISIQDVQLQVDDSLDLKWIPSRPRYTTPVSCKLCSYSTCKRSELIEHLIGHALPQASYRCSVCGVTERNYFDLLDHLGAHTGEYRYRCNYCDFRCCDRKGIKSHMLTMHESQDQLFYLMEIPDVDKLCVYAYACKNCRYYQMSEEHLKRHRKQHENCNEYVKFCMIQTENKTGSDGVFVCPALESVASKEVVSENELAETLKIGETSWIKNLAEKLNSPEQQVTKKENKSNETPPSAEKKNHVPVKKENKTSETPPSAETKNHVPVAHREKEAKLQDNENPSVAEINREDKTKIERKNEKALETGSPVERSTPVEEKRCEMSDDSSVTDANDSVIILDTIVNTPKQAAVAWKKNSLLETTISKLAGKLGAAEAGALSDEEEDDESLEEEEEEDEESSEEADEQTSKPVETSFSDFLKISSVMSLNDEEIECLDPLEDVIVHSNVVLLKDQVTFPFRVDHDRWQMVKKLKTPEMYGKMTERSRLICFFKCVAFKCFFACDSAADFANHLKWHSKMYLAPKTKEIPVHRMHPSHSSSATLTFPDFLLCAYCPFGARTAEELVDHVESRHRDCSHQCSVCFFRGWQPKAVALHILTSHPGNWAPVLACPRVKTESDLQVDRFSSLRETQSYKCFAENCKFVCHHNQTLAVHLAGHLEGTRFKCPDCFEQVMPQEEFKGIFSHLRKHSIGFFQCSLCCFGTDLPGDAVIHHCLKHPWLDGKVIVRSGDPLEGSKTMAVFGVPSHSWRMPIDFNVNYKELLYFVKVMESKLSSEEDVPEIKEIEETNEQEDAELNGDEKSEDTTLEFVEKEEKEAEFHGFADNECKEAEKAIEKQTECIVIESDDEPAKEEEPPIQKVAQELAENEDEVQDGLYGRQLYICGNIGCDETAETSSAFKDHLLMCDLARDSRILTCRHCGKNMKQVANLMDHLRVHGVKRFSCGLCNFRSYLACQVKKHMKTIHKTPVVDEVNTGHGPGPAINENAQFSFYPRELMAKLRLRPRQKSVKSKSYTCHDVTSIPKKSIFSLPIRCGHCGYSSKIRSNIIRHLSLHRFTDSSAPSSENEEIVPKVIIPHQDPVNPVPLVENPSKGRMFDKMANLAGSSHEAPRDKEKEKANQPVFIPDHQRFICGFDGCSHLTISDAMLKAHLSTLHKNGLFKCPHCVKKEEEPMTMDGYRMHLKMHGPKLYKCGHCLFYHFQLSEIDGHLLDKHPNRPPWRYIIREPEDKEVKKQNSKGARESCAPWGCGLCKFVAGSMIEMQAHAEAVHSVKSQYKCAICPVRCNVRSEFERHFNSKHPNQEVQVLTLYFKKEEELKETMKEDKIQENPEPLWKRNEVGLRHIRGILLDENELTEVPPEDGQVESNSSASSYGSFGNPINGQLVCPKCNNYRATYGRDMKFHLYRELDYKKYLCTICNEGFPTRPLCLKHIEKSHPASGALIREISYNAALENWVDQVIKHQTNALKAIRMSNNKANSKKVVTQSAPAAPNVPNSPLKSPVKAKKPANQTVVPNSPFICLACRHVAVTQEALEDHVQSSHTDGGIVCLECGFRAATTLAIANHQNRTKHAKTYEPPEVKEELVDREESQKKEKQLKNAYQCRHCKFTAPTEHNLNLHWQTRHSAAKLALEFNCLNKNGTRTLVYKCQYCNVKPGLYDEMHEHSKSLHPELPIKLFRVTAKIKTEPTSDSEEPTNKKQKDDLTKPIQLTSTVTISLSPSKRPRQTNEAVPSVTITPKAPEPPVLTPARQEVYVVAPQKSQPMYSCVWCCAQFSTEAQVIRHHSSHADPVPLRYSCVDSSKSLVQKPELIIMEIHFNCPVCSKSFMSLSLATRHVREHKQAWKCCHCVKLFLTPVDALQHMRDVHPGVQGRLESIDSPNEVFEKLSKGILCSRVQLKKSPTVQVKELPGANPSTVTPPAPPKLTQAIIAKKSTTANSFLRENSTAGPSHKSD